MTRAGPEFSTAQDRVHVDYLKLLETLKKDSADFVALARTIEANFLEERLVLEDVFATTRETLRIVQERHEAAKEEIRRFNERHRLWRSMIADAERRDRRMARTERKLRRFARGGFLQSKFVEGFCAAIIAKGAFLLWLVFQAANDPY